jgi:hypothetical protein
MLLNYKDSFFLFKWITFDGIQCLLSYDFCWKRFHFLKGSWCDEISCNMSRCFSIWIFFSYSLWENFVLCGLCQWWNPFVIIVLLFVVLQSYESWVPSNNSLLFDVKHINWYNVLTRLLLCDVNLVMSWRFINPSTVISWRFINPRRVFCSSDYIFRCVLTVLVHIWKTLCVCVVLLVAFNTPCACQHLARVLLSEFCPTSPSSSSS